jgi:hypothetical protein
MHEQSCKKQVKAVEKERRPKKRILVVGESHVKGMAQYGGRLQQQ